MIYFVVFLILCGVGSLSVNVIRGFKIFVWIRVLCRCYIFGVYGGWISKGIGVVYVGVEGVRLFE